MGCYSRETPHIAWKFLEYKSKLLELLWELEADIPAENF
jgi:hypothetical protein